MHSESSDIIIPRQLADFISSRYEIEDDEKTWADAEKQMMSATKRGQSNPVVSVKTKSKRKERPTTAEDVYKETFGDESRSKSKKRKGKH